MTRPSTATPKKPGLNNAYVTQCKACHLGVYQHQQWQWSTSPLGIVHTEVFGAAAMTLFACLCSALSVCTTAALLPSTVDATVWRAIRGRYVRGVETVAATVGALTILTLFAVGWVVAQLTDFHQQAGGFGSGVYPWHA